MTGIKPERPQSMDHTLTTEQKLARDEIVLLLIYSYLNFGLKMINLCILNKINKKKHSMKNNHIHRKLIGQTTNISPIMK